MGLSDRENEISLEFIMLSPLNQNTQKNEIIKIDYSVLDSIKKSWMVPRDTGKLVMPDRQNPIRNENNKAGPKLDNTIIYIP
jgi:hypothetical protein